MFSSEAPLTEEEMLKKFPVGIPTVEFLQLLMAMISDYAIQEKLRRDIRLIEDYEEARAKRLQESI